MRKNWQGADFPKATPCLAR